MDSITAATSAALTGFGNEFASEALPGALPSGRNSPQRPPLGLYAEQLTCTPFTAPRREARRSWLYRIRPSAEHPPYLRCADQGSICGPLAPPNPNRLRWNPWPIPTEPTDFLAGLATVAATGTGLTDHGVSVHIYVANASMQRVFFNADGELLILPQHGRIDIATEMGHLHAAPGHVVIIPRGVRFRVALPDGPSRGYVCENHGTVFRLPDLGPIGANGLANPRDFHAPNAAFEDVQEPTEIVQKYCGELWATTLSHSPLDVVAWHGNLTPMTYDLARFNTIGTVSFDHPDPSILTVLTAPTDTPGKANADFVIFPPRWMVAEDTFRPPWFHRNIMNECMGLIDGQYDAKAEGFLPGGMSLHAMMSAHGPDAATTDRAMTADLSPHKIDGSLAFMFETSSTLRPTAFAMASPALQERYDSCWDGMTKFFHP